jgi:hypothetical protein
MHAPRSVHAETANRLVHDALTLLDGELDEGFVFESTNGSSVIVIANPAFEARVAT